MVMCFPRYFSWQFIYYLKLVYANPIVYYCDTSLRSNSFIMKFRNPANAGPFSISYRGELSGGHWLVPSIQRMEPMPDIGEYSLSCPKAPNFMLQKSSLFFLAIRPEPHHQYHFHHFPKHTCRYFKRTADSQYRSAIVFHIFYQEDGT